MGRTLLPKFPRDQDERLWKYIRVLLLGESDDSDIDDPLLIRPPSHAPSSVANTIPSSTSVSLSSLVLNGESSASMNGGTMATAGMIGPRHGNNKNTTLTLVSSSTKTKVTLLINNTCYISHPVLNAAQPQSVKLQSAGLS